MSKATRRLGSWWATGLSGACGTALLLSSVMAAPAPATMRPSGAPPKDSRDVVVVRGCVESGTLTNVAAADGEATGDGGAGPTYRIAGSRALTKQLRREHEGHTEEITGRIKGE